MITASRLRYRVEFLKLAQANDTRGMESQWATYKTLWADVQFERGRNALNTYALSQEQSVVITIYKRNDIDCTMRVRFADTLWQLSKPVIDANSMQFIATSVNE
jgi:phage head-tail adaptor, putative, SPP1 family